VILWSLNLLSVLSLQSFSFGWSSCSCISFSNDFLLRFCQDR